MKIKCAIEHMQWLRIYTLGDVDNFGRENFNFLSVTRVIVFSKCLD